MRRTLLPLALAGAALAAAPALARAPKPKTVKVFDNYYQPSKLTVKPNTTVTWKWPQDGGGGDVHDVKLTKRPKGVKAFHSEPAASYYSFKRKLTRTGDYKIVCTLHEEMTMTIKVRK